MTINMYKLYKEGGFNMLPHILSKTLGAVTTLVLSETVAQLNYADNNKLNYNSDFLCDLNRMANLLGLSEDELWEQLEKLENLKFIKVFNANIEDTSYIRVYQDNIINFKKEQEEKLHFGSWDDGLKRSQNPIHKTANFSDSTNFIKNFLDERLKDPESIPLAAYSYFNDVLNCFENKYGDIRKFPDLLEILTNYVLDTQKNTSIYYNPKDGFQAFIEMLENRTNNND